MPALGLWHEDVTLSETADAETEIAWRAVSGLRVDGRAAARAEAKFASPSAVSDFDVSRGFAGRDLKRIIVDEDRHLKAEPESV